MLPGGAWGPWARGSSPLGCGRISSESVEEESMEATWRSEINLIQVIVDDKVSLSLYLLEAQCDAFSYSSSSNSGKSLSSLAIKAS